MKPSIDVTQSARFVWLCAGLVLLAGYYPLGVRYQRAVDAAGEAAQGLYERASANERIIDQAVRLRHIESRVETDIARARPARAQAAGTAALLVSVAEVAARYHAHAISVAPAGDAPRPASDASEPPPPLVGSDVEIRLRGRFRDLLHCIEELSHHGVLLFISDTQLALGNQAADAVGSTPELEATVHATLYRLAAPPRRSEVSDARLNR
ncbi:MAG TPA: hypothetical protein VIG32_01820 [Candidatus Baltobacteraceae bacterium]